MFFGCKALKVWIAFIGRLILDVHNMEKSSNTSWEDTGNSLSPLCTHTPHSTDALRWILLLQMQVPVSGESVSTGKSDNPYHQYIPPHPNMWHLNTELQFFTSQINQIGNCLMKAHHWHGFSLYVSGNKNWRFFLWII